MSNIFACNVRGLNNSNKQIEVVKTVKLHHIGLFGLLETKVKRHGLGLFYQLLSPNWCLTNNVHWHKGGRIIVGWNQDVYKVDIVDCTSQYIHVKVCPVIGEMFFCSFVYGAFDSPQREIL